MQREIEMTQDIGALTDEELDAVSGGADSGPVVWDRIVRSMWGTYEAVLDH